MNKIISICALLMLSACSSVADAGHLVDIAVVSRSSGQQLETYRHQGKLYVVGTPGERYSVKIINRTGGRVMSVLSVDGVNAVTGETAAAKQSGYVLSPWETPEIRGWRKNMDDVAAFYFTALPNSYAARTGRPDNVGVIGVAVFQEYVEPVVERKYEPEISSNANRGASGANGRNEQASGRPNSMAKQAAPAASPPAEVNRGSALSDKSAYAENKPRSSDSAERRKDERAEKMAERVGEKIGTGHGERLNDPTRYTEFRRASDTPTEVVAIYYDSRENLLARGIIPRPRTQPKVQYRPQPFPGGFVLDPQS